MGNGERNTCMFRISGGRRERLPENRTAMPRHPDDHEALGLPHPPHSPHSPFPIPAPCPPSTRSEEHTYELQSLMRISYAVFCSNKKHKLTPPQTTPNKLTTQHQK